ncbi:2-phosphoxylose phosphatase 1 [Agrilus planipennis]|uniref:2-phosphoxylose phosphatase 1 n=1 Tax=Agrilus planipennis TaxID=224129 RepID=A0A1W4WVS8_AGRPL|nr:2-phosphoxylose phosphatase 1 [Agrilus planipennis]XP_018327973.1 2-phosphoxylose phosphatase 1 [Agrilus planipennis]XP_018327974.1 2-phosphoxylose phosphatase 1 [Agrilus planipennis]
MEKSMTIDILRGKTQNKALHCYIILSIWILVLIAGVYKFLEPQPRGSIPTVVTELFQNLAIDVRTKKIFKICNFPEDIYFGDEGTLNSKQWNLRGLIILTRHGDRGPLQHVRNITYINCGKKTNTELLKGYQEYMKNLSSISRVSWIGPGPFHGFPLLPTHYRQCQLGQLSMQGVAQLLKVGQILRQSYLSIWPKLTNLTPAEVLVYSTRYRRTFQSALALLYGLISTETLNKVNIFESHSISFCFRECGCPMADKYFRKVKNYLNQQLISHPAVSVLTDTTSQLIFPPGIERGPLKRNPFAVKDALLTYICHGSGLPCDNSAACVKRHNVAGIFSYTEWVIHQKWGYSDWKRFCLLKAYGLIRNIVSHMLHMVSNTGPYLVLYSGHDHTLEELSTALGLKSDPLLLRYGARIIFEVYHDNREPQSVLKDVYFRVLANGKDVTSQVDFCKNIVNVEKRSSLCKIEDIVRYIHEDYFSSFNATNYKDACVAKHF